MKHPPYVRFIASVILVLPIIASALPILISSRIASSELTYARQFQIPPRGEKLFGAALASLAGAVLALPALIFSSSINKQKAYTAACATCFVLGLLGFVIFVFVPF